MAEFLPNIDFKLFTGQIEDNEDPLKLGRVRVRVHGYYTTDEEALPTDDLPWAHVTYNDSLRAYTPSIDEWVVGFFLDGDEAQKPVIIGVLPGINADPVEPSTSRWARNERVNETDQYDKKSDTASIGSIKEPDSPYDAEYPYNKVIETSSGHLIEIDDTEGAERLHIYHKSGTFHEYHPDGKMVSKSVGDSYEIHVKNHNTIVQENDTTEIEGDLTINVTGEVNLKADGKVIVDGSQVEINGNSKSFVTWAELDTALAAWKGSIEGQVNTQLGIIAGHTHVGNLGYPTAPPVPPPTSISTSLDISPSETQTVKTGG